MTHHDDLDQLLSTWLDDPHTPPAPRYLGQVLERTRRTRQRPAWASLERWLPMASRIPGRAAAPPLRTAWLLLIALIVVALAASVVFVGSQLLRSVRPDDSLKSTVAIAQGGAAVFAFGSISSDSEGVGDIFTVRADGTQIAYRAWLGGTDSIVVVDAGGGHPATLATTPASQSYCARGGFAWSPDGKSLIFPANVLCDSAIDLFIVATDGSSPATRLIAAGTNGAAAAWSPDGKRIAFVGSEAGGGLGTYVADVGSGGALSGGLRARRIGPGLAGTLDKAATGPQWSPDGTQLVSLNETGGIVIMQADGSGQRVVSTEGDGTSSPVWSPDGRQLAYYRGVDPADCFQDRTCTVRTWVIDADGTDERRLDPVGDGRDLPVSWSPDGTRLAVLVMGMPPADPSQQFHLSMIALDGSAPIVTLGDATSGSWQPVAAPLPPAPSFPAQ